VKRSLHQECCYAVQAAHPSHDGISVSRLEVRYSLPYQKTASVAVQEFRIATSAPWYIGNRQIHDDLGVPIFSEHIRSLAERFDSKLTYVGKPLVEQLG